MVLVRAADSTIRHEAADSGCLVDNRIRDEFLHGWELVVSDFVNKTELAKKIDGMGQKLAW
jgi:hypothetical protein